MSIKVSTKLINDDIDVIYNALKEIKNLTPRTKKALLKSRIAVAHDNSKLVGWIVSEHLTEDIYELGGAYIYPNYRKKGIFSKLTNELIATDNTYVLAVYDPVFKKHIIDSFNFVETSLWQIIIISRGQFFFKRFNSLLRVASHLKRQPASYLIKKNYNA